MAEQLPLPGFPDGDDAPHHPNAGQFGHGRCPTCGRPARKLPAGPHRFDGKTYEPAIDQARLTGQMRRVYDLMNDGQWRTLATIATDAGCSEASASARLRDLRKPRFGEFEIERQRVGESGLFLYRMPRAK